MTGTVFPLCILFSPLGCPNYIGAEITPILPDLDNASEGKEENRETPIKVGASFLLNDASGL
jgi:hypothetical protein